MGKSILITGGARSGKSQIAETWVSAAGDHPIYIATGQAFDAEMTARIDRHIARRGPEWTTVQEPLHLVKALGDTDGKGPRLVDCLTLWLSNLMHANADWQQNADTLADAITRQSSDVTFVTNEVGQGIVPETPLGRTFRDAQGQLNQTIAQAVDEVYLAVAGYPLKVKPHA